MDWLVLDLLIVIYFNGVIFVMIMDLKIIFLVIVQMDLDGMFFQFDLLYLFKVLQLFFRGMFVVYVDIIFFLYIVGSYDKVIVVV